MISSLTKVQEVTLTQNSQQPYQEVAEQRGQYNEDQIAEIAYYKAENRGFSPGNALNDWLEAEQELTLSCENGD
jgi:hypothetical protein